jgi:ATP-binding cassette subfamily F protein 3
LLRLESVNLAPGGHDLLRDADWHVREGDHIGLVGRNGAGKTTLLRALAGEMSPASGRVLGRNGVLIGYLPQQAVSGSSASVWVEASSRMVRLKALEEQLAHAQAMAERGDAGAAQRLADATETYRLAGGFRKDQRIGEVLHGLGFGPDSWHRSCETFSGGWQMRIALARLLLSEPDVALLDEPTNHLDMSARSWLASFLAAAPWAFVVVSHDRHLLDVGVSRIAEVRGGKLHHYAGNFTAFLKERELRAVQQEAAAEKLEDERAKLQSFVDRFGAKATKAAQAKSKQKALDRLGEAEAPDRAPPLPRFELPEAPAGAFEALTLVKADVGWDAPVVRGLTFTLERGMRLALLGPNGCGKSTLLQVMAGRLAPLVGRRQVGDRSRIGVFDQDLAAALPGDVDGLGYLSGLAPDVPPQRLRAILGALGLPGDMALRPIGQLSGGEKARVALAALVVRPHNVLLLDEPTNHLDVETVEVLVRALENFSGALLLVTHDRYLVEQLATHVGRVVDGQMDLHPGVRPEDLEPGGALADSASDEPKVKALAHDERKAMQRERQRAARQLDEIEAEITTMEAELAALEQRLFDVASDHVASAKIMRDQASLSKRMEQRWADWEALGVRVAELDASL